MHLAIAPALAHTPRSCDGVGRFIFCTSSRPYPSGGNLSAKKMRVLSVVVLLLAALPRCSATDASLSERLRLAISLHSASARLDIPGSTRLPTLLARRAFVPGSTLALRRFMDRWQAGEELTVAVVGGSVSLGQECARCAKYDGTFNLTWSRLVFDALAAAQPRAKLHYVNGAVGGAGAAFFNSCLGARIPLGDPTLALVFVEVAVNSNQYDLAGVEGIVRGLLGRRNAAQPEPIAIVFVDWHRRFPGFLAQQGLPFQHEWLDGASRITSVVASYYDIPLVSMRSALLAEDMAGTAGLSWRDFGADWIHANDLGHQLISHAVLHALTSALREGAADPTAEAAAPHLAATGLGLGQAASVASLPPLAANNTVEAWGLSCLYGAALPGAAQRSAGWAWNVSNPAKPGWTTDGGEGNALALRVESAHGAAILSYISGWDAGSAELSCEGGCACAPIRVDAWRERLRVTAQHPLDFSQAGAGCLVVVRAVADAAGRRGFKVVALVVGGPGVPAGSLYSAPEVFEGGVANGR